MAISFTRLPWWLWGSKEKDPVVSNNSPLNSSSEWRRESVKFPLVKGTKISPPSHRKVKRKRQSREERRIDRECDVVLVPSDGGGFLSGAESDDDSDWSIGWLEPHGSDFQSEDEADNSFAVLVPCYRTGCEEMEGSNNELLSAIKNLPNELSHGGKNYMEQWLASLQNF